MSESVGKWRYAMEVNNHLFLCYIFCTYAIINTPYLFVSCRILFVRLFSTPPVHIPIYRSSPASIYWLPIQIPHERAVTNLKWVVEKNFPDEQLSSAHSERHAQAAPSARPGRAEDSCGFHVQPGVTWVIYGNRMTHFSYFTSCYPYSHCLGYLCQYYNDAF